MDNRFVSSVCFCRKYDWDDQLNNRPNRRDHLTNQILYNNRHNIPGTYLLQYDAVMDDFYFETCKKEYAENGAEIGIWFEVVRPLTDDSKVRWRGAEHRTWEPYVNAGFLMGYEREEKMRLIDTFFEGFHSRFGFYPKTVGSWLLDSESMQYMSEKYEPDAFIICREQWGMDGYTLWGGPYYGPYYPCKNNAQCPAQTLQEQINTPLFRMYINDPIYCYYEYDSVKYNGFVGVAFTQEPAGPLGQSPEWVRWHYENTFKEDNIGFCFTQLGQENSMGWRNKVEFGFTMQCTYAEGHQEDFGYRFVQFHEMGRRFKMQHKMTPPSGRFVLDDWAGRGNKSLWYNSAHYRINLFADKEQVWIRDIHLFDETYRDKYLDEPCTTKAAIYDNLPIMDGIRFSDEDIRAGMYFGKGTIESVKKVGEEYDIWIALENKRINLLLKEDCIIMQTGEEFVLDYIVSPECKFIVSAEEKQIIYEHGGIMYMLELERGKYRSGKLYSETKQIILKMRKYDKIYGTFGSMDKNLFEFHNAQKPPFKIYGVTKENGRFRRLPESVAKQVNECVAAFHTNTAGGRVRFVTDSKNVAVRVKIADVINDYCNIGVSGYAGLDLYASMDGEDEYQGTFLPPYESRGCFERFVEVRGEGERVITIHLPSYSSLYEIYVGVEKGASLKSVPEYAHEVPVVFYGSSITQGGCASRPGNSYQNILSRQLDFDYINLGFSNGARGEECMSEWISGLTMKAFVMDYDNNAPTAEHLAATHEKMFRAIRKNHPELPILLLSRPKFFLTEDDARRLEIIRTTYQNAIAAGDQNVYMIEGPDLMKTVKNEGTVDGVHPNDAGFMSMAAAIKPVLEKILG